MTDGMAGKTGAPSGIRGWLLFFLVTLGICLPVRAASNAAGWFAPEAEMMFDGLGRLIVLYDLAIQLLTVVGALTAVAFLVFRQHWSSVRLTLVSLWVLSAISILNGLPVLPLARIGAVDPAHFLITMLPMPLFAAIWTIYLLRSKRVANTYHRPGRIEANVFS